MVITAHRLKLVKHLKENVFAKLWTKYMAKIYLHLRIMYTKSLIPHSSTPVMFVLYCSYWC